MQVLLHPRVVERIHQGHAILRLLDQQLGDEILHFFGQVARELEVHGQNLLVGLFPAFRGLERSVTGAELVAEDSDTPHIHHLVVLIAQHDLGRDVIEGAAKGASFRTK